MATTTRISGKGELLGADIQNNDVLLIEHDVSGEDVDKKIKFSTLKTKVLSDLVDGTTPSAKATADASGNDIEQTYATKSELSAVSDDVDDIADGTIVVGKATADADGNPIKSTYAKLSGGTFTGDVTVQGDFTVEGTSYETHTEQLFTKKDEIITRDGASTGLASGEYTGLRAKKYDGTNDGRLVFDSTGTARVGDIGDEEPLATREEASNMTDGALLEWDGTNKRIKSSTRSVAVIDDTVSSPTSAYSSQKVDTMTATDSAISTSSNQPLQNNIVTANLGCTICTTAIGTQSKTVVINGFSLYTGAVIRVMFTNGNSVASPTLNVKSSSTDTTGTGAKYLRVIKAGQKCSLASSNSSTSVKAVKSGFWRGSTSKSSEMWQPYTTLELMYDGTYWVIIGNPVVESYYTDSTSTNSYKVYADGSIEQWGHIPSGGSQYTNFKLAVEHSADSSFIVTGHPDNSNNTQIYFSELPYIVDKGTIVARNNNCFFATRGY